MRMDNTSLQLILRGLRTLFQNENAMYVQFKVLFGNSSFSMPTLNIYKTFRLVCCTFCMRLC